MKKLLMTITSIALLLTLSLSLVACSSYGKIEKALEEIGYAKVESSQEAEDLEEESEVQVISIPDKKVKKLINKNNKIKKEPK